MPLTTVTLSKDINNCATNLLPAFIEMRMHGYYERLENLGGNHLLHGRPPAANAIHLSSNDYLCLIGQPELVRAQSASLEQGSCDLLMSASFLHGENPQSRLERKIAQHLLAEDGILCQSGWNANVGLIQSLAGPDVPVYLDMLAHASMWEGARSAEARPIPFMHNDANHLERQIQKHGVGIIAIDSVYSTNGSLCPIRDMVAVAEKTGCIIVVDESHSYGTHGPYGAGLVAELGLHARVHFRTASLAKAFAGRAGFIACSSRFKDYFLTEARPAIFSSCLLHHELAWFEAALTFIHAADNRRSRLHSNAQTLRAALAMLGYNVTDGSEQIVSLESGTESQTLVLRNALEENGIFGSVFCAPATPKNRSLMRFTVNSGLTEVEIEHIIEVCAKIRDQVRMQDWPSTRRLNRRAAEQRNMSA